MGLRELTRYPESSTAQFGTQHPDAQLAPKERQRTVDRVVEHSWSIEATADRFQVDAKTVRKWRDRFLAGRGGTVGSVVPTEPITESTPVRVRVRVRVRQQNIQLPKKRWSGAEHIAHEVGLAFYAAATGAR